jgi:CHAT domain-containing protein
MASLWKVHEAKTKELMVIVYHYHHLLLGNSCAEALRKAKLECVRKGFLPLDRAGFVMIGR